MKKYNTKEVQSLLGISKDTWKRRYEEIQEYLKLYWDYQTKEEGRCNYYIIIKEYGELQPLPRKKKSQEMKQFYAKETEHIIQYKPRNTGVNIAREIVDKNNKYSHAEGTAANYIRPILKEEYMVSDKKEWCCVNYDKYTYEPLTEKQLVYLKQLFQQYMGEESIANIVAEQEAGYRTKEEAFNSIKGLYNDAMEAFKEQYGFRPYKVGEYAKRAF